MRIRIEQFGGIAPNISPHLLPPHMAIEARNCRFGSGALEPWRVTDYVADLAKAGVKKSLFRYGENWFHWLEDVDIVRAPVALDAYGRVYWTGEGYPRAGGTDVVTSGGGIGYPTGSYRMGVPAPGSSPTVTASGEPVEGLIPVARVYCITYVNGYGGEGPPSDPSVEVEVTDGQSVTVTMLEGAPSGGYNVVTKNVYRTEKGSSTSEWLLVGSVAAAATTFVDDVPAANLTTVLPSLDWDGPPDGLAGLVDHPMGSLAGFSGKELLFSVPFRPHAWPYRYAVSDPIVAIGVYGTYVLVTTTGKPYLFSGSDPASMSREHLEKGEACVSKRGLVDMGVACIYPGPSGLWGAGLGDVSLLTEKVLGLEDWRAYHPETIMGTHYAGQYIGFYDAGSRQAGFIFDPKSGDFTDIDLYATAAWNDPTTGRLYLVVDGKVVEWHGGQISGALYWRSRPYYLETPANLACAKVTAQSYPITLEVYADDALVHSRLVESAHPFWLPSGFRALKWQVAVSGDKKIESVTLAGSMRELQG